MKLYETKEQSYADEVLSALEVIAKKHIFCIGAFRGTGGSNYFDSITGTKTFPGLSRLAGQGSYNAAFKMALTKLMKGQIKNVVFQKYKIIVRKGLFLFLGCFPNPNN